MMSDNDVKTTSQLMTYFQDSNEARNIQEPIDIRQETSNVQQESNNLQQELNNLQQESNNLQKESNNLQQQSKKLQQETNFIQQETNFIQQDINNVTEDGQDENQQEMMNMFASVWVKVEVSDEHDQEDNQIVFESNQDSSTKPRLKRNRISSYSMKCNQCDYTTAFKNCLEIHILGHGGAKTFSCTQCDYTTKHPTALQRHIFVKHQCTSDGADLKAPLVFKCEKCDYSTTYKWNLYAHNRKHLEKKYKCNVPDCDYVTSYSHNLQKHSKRHNDSTFYKCDKCPFVTRFEGHITRHLAKIHNVVMENMSKCDLCDFSTKIRWRLNIHKQRSRQGSLLKCKYCDFETFYMCESKKHKVTHYGEIYNKKKAALNLGSTGDACDTPASDTCSHMNESEVAKDSEMDVQTEKYTLDPDCLDWHSIQVLESEDKDKPFQCHMCNYTARFKASVQRHFQRHHTGSHNRPYKCINCDFSTKTKDQIALHNKRSKSNVVIYCNNCEFSTKFKCQLVMHQKSHYEHKCPKCEYTCKLKYELQKHFTTVHLGSVIKCKYCDYTASRKDSLLCHMTVHTGVKPYKCMHCDYTSVRKCLLNNHIKRYHSDIRDDVTIVSENKIQSLKLPVENIVELQQLDL